MFHKSLNFENRHINICIFSFSLNSKLPHVCISWGVLPYFQCENQFPGTVEIILVCTACEFSLNEWTNSYWFFFFLSYFYFCSDLYSVQWHLLRLPSKAFQLKEILQRMPAMGTSSATNNTFTVPSTNMKYRSRVSSSTWKVTCSCHHPIQVLSARLSGPCI